MRHPLRRITLAGALALTTLGCDQPPASTPESVNQTESHDHPSEGPHHGALVELGEEQYHAEIVHDEQAGQVVVYLLDGSAMKASPVDAAEVTLNLTHDGKPEQFLLAANPDATDPAGATSRFTSTAPELLEDLEHGHAAGQLVITIGGQQYRGALPHFDHDDHDHEEHDH